MVALRALVAPAGSEFTCIYKLHVTSIYKRNVGLVSFDLIPEDRIRTPHPGEDARISVESCSSPRCSRNKIRVQLTAWLRKEPEKTK